MRRPSSVCVLEYFPKPKILYPDGCWVNYVLLPIPTYLEGRGRKVNRSQIWRGSLPYLVVTMQKHVSEISKLFSLWCKSLIPKWMVVKESVLWGAYCEYDISFLNFKSVFQLPIAWIFFLINVWYIPYRPVACIYLARWCGVYTLFTVDRLRQFNMHRLFPRRYAFAFCCQGPDREFHRC